MRTSISGGSNGVRIYQPGFVDCVVHHAACKVRDLRRLPWNYLGSVTIVSSKMRFTVEDELSPNEM